MPRTLFSSILGVCLRLSPVALLLAGTLAGCSGKGGGKPAAPGLDAAASTPGPGGAGPGRGDDWVPSEFKKGQARWKDVGVYVDGKPIGVLAFGELPISLKPTWIEEEASIPLKPGYKGPQVKVIRQRGYKMTEYLAAAGVDVAKIKELHVYGPRFTDSVIVGGDELRKRKDELLFRFGGEVRGKPIPIVPDDYGNQRSPDKITAVIVYIDKKPPKLERNVGLILDGEVQHDVPYYGEPMRGGVRVYLDDRLATVIKRKELEESGADGAPLKLMDYVGKRGVDTSKVVEAWLIRDDKRVLKLDQAAVAAASFEVSAQAEGKVLIAKQPANAIALHTRVLAPDDLPKILPEEDGGKVEWPRGVNN